MRVALVVLTLMFLLAGCHASWGGAGSKEPVLLPTPSAPWSPEVGIGEYKGWPYPTPIDWSKYEPKDLKQQIDKAGKNHDCDTIDKLFSDATAYKGPNQEVLTYIDRTGRYYGCPHFAKDDSTSDDEAAPDNVEHKG